MESVAQPPVQHSDAVSSVEMTFATQALNRGGLLLLLCGLAVLLRAQSAGHATGLVPTALGIVAGVVLMAWAERCHRTGEDDYASPLACGGLSLVAVSVLAAHFYFGLIPKVVLFGSLAGVVTVSGLVAIRYGSRLSESFVLALLFGAPIVMHFSMNALPALFSYLLAICTGVAWVAFHRKSDAYLIAAFVGTYVAFFHHSGLSHPVAALLFLTLVYAIFLAANHGLHFRRRSCSHYDLILSYVNPVVYAVTSYTLMARMPSALGAAIYLTIGCVQVLLTMWSQDLRRQDESFRDVAQNNLVLGLLFLTAAVSFVPYAVVEGTYMFTTVTTLWFGEAFLLLHLRSRLGDFGLIVYRYAILALILCSFQVFWVVPTLPDGWEPILTRIMAAGLYWTWFVAAWRKWDPDSQEEHLCLILSAVASFSVLAVLLLENSHNAVPWALLTVLLGIAADRYRSAIGRFDYLAVGGAVGMALLCASGAWPTSVPTAMGAGAVLLVLRSQVRDVWAVDAVVCAILAMWMRATLDGCAGPVSTVAWALSGLVLLRMPSVNLYRVAKCVLMAAFLKSVFTEAAITNHAASHVSDDALAALAQVGIYLVAAWQARSDRESRDFFLVLGLLISAFQASLRLFFEYGTWLGFQPLLSAFWAASAFGWIVAGIRLQLKVLRLFGLVLLVATVAKQLLVDMYVLNSYSQTTMLVLMGCTLMAVSALYQSQRWPQRVLLSKDVARSVSV